MLTRLRHWLAAYRHRRLLARMARDAERQERRRLRDRRAEAYQVRRDWLRS